MKFVLICLFVSLSSLKAVCQPYFVKTACGMEYSMALRSDSSLWSWGINGNGQLGINSKSATDIPTRIMAPGKWIYCTAGAFHSVAINADSTLWGWGYNLSGQLGKGTVDTSILAPYHIDTINHWKAVSAGYLHTIAIRADGTIWSAGFNYFGQLGTNDTSNHATFTQVGASDVWQNVSAGGLFTMAIKKDGTLWAWGYNGDGELGINSTISQKAPVQVGTATNWKAVSAGFEFTIALKSDGTLWSCGFNGDGQLGRSTSGADSNMRQIGTDTDWNFIAAGSSYAFAIKKNGTLWGWGYNQQGQLGLPIATTVNKPTLVGSDTDWQFIAAASGGLSSGYVFGTHSCGYKINAKSVCVAGSDYVGQLGNGMETSTPQAFFDCSVLAATNVPLTMAISNNVYIYPNPASDYLYINFRKAINSQPVHITIFNQNGEKEITKTISANNMPVSLDVRGLVPGLYFVLVDNVSLEFVKK